MNSQFTNSNFGRILYVAIISLIVAATIFVVWYMTTGYKLGTYASDTMLGSVYIGGLSEEEVTPKLEDRVNYWYSDETIVFELSYQGYSYEFDRNLFLFDVEASIYGIQDGLINEFVVYYQGSDREGVEDDILSLEFLEDVADNIEIQQLINDIILDASLMKSFSSKNVEDYLTSPEDTIAELGSASFTIPEGVEIDNIISDVNTVFADGKILIPANDLFDIVSILGNNMESPEMTVLASAMLSLSLDTNFVINEVHYEPSIDFTRYTIENFPFYARNTHINEVVGESFSFYNPNVSAYYFMIEKIDEFNGELKLYGIPFEYEIEVTIERTEIEYITQSTNDISLLQNGYNGVIVEVERVITDIFGNVVSTEVILFEFYPPKKEIINQP